MFTGKALHAGLDFGGTKCAGAIIDRHGRLLAFHELPIRPSWSARDLERFGCSILEHLCAHIRTPFTRIRTCGIGIPAPVRNGHADFAPNLSHISDIRPTRMLPDIRTTIENDAICSLYAERLFGHLTKAKTGILLTIGTGCGCAMVEKIHAPHAKRELRDHVTPLEIGHICVDIHSELRDVSDRPYELEAYCSRVFFKRHVKKPFERILRQAKDGDDQALRVLETFGAYVGTTIATLDTLFRPDHIVISGGLSAGFSVFAPAMRHAYAIRRFPVNAPKTHISTSSFGPELGAYGAALVGWKNAENEQEKRSWDRSY